MKLLLSYAMNIKRDKYKIILLQVKHSHELVSQLTMEPPAHATFLYESSKLFQQLQ